MSMPKIECNDMDKCCAAASLLQSIALEETAISHILNAEGEKLQKAVKMEDCSYEDLLCINKSVEDMVDKITNLEIVLKSKLDLIRPILDDCGQKPDKPDKDKDCKSDCKPKDKPEDKPSEGGGYPFYEKEAGGRVILDSKTTD